MRHVFRVFVHDLRGWTPSIVAVTLISALIGTCVNQFVWTKSPDFMNASDEAGIGASAFRMVSTSIYVVVALLAVVSLTVVGAATIERTRSTFALWRLMGATPRQVRAGSWMRVTLASMVGALPGSVLSVGLSHVAVPVFNEMAATGFPGGVADFDPPPFSPSFLAWLCAFAVSVATCMGRAAVPIFRAGGVEPVEALRGVGFRHGLGGWGRWIPGAGLLAWAAVIGQGAVSTVDPLRVGVSAAMTANAAMMAGLVAAVGIYLLGPPLVRAVLVILQGVATAARMPVVHVALRSARSRADQNANTIAPMAVAVGLGGVMFTVLPSYLELMSVAGFPVDTPNFADAAVLCVLFAVVALLTSIAVIALGGRDQIQEQATLRATGMSPRQVGRMMMWQALAVGASAVLLGLIPIGLASWIVVESAEHLTGRQVLVLPVAGIVGAGVVCWVTVWAMQWLQVAAWLRREVAAGLRRPD